MGMIIDSYRFGSFDTYSIEFDGIDETVQAPDNATLEPTSLTVSAWIKIGTHKNYNVIVNKFDFNAARNGYSLYVPLAGTLNAFIANAVAFQIITGGTVLSAGTWYHVAVTRNNTDIRLYVNASSDAAPVASTLTPAYSTEVFSIGQGQGFAGTFFNGKIDEVSLWNKALSLAEITELYNGGKPMNLVTHSATANLISWWRMGDGDTYPTIQDQIGSNDGTMINMEAGDFSTDVP